MPNLGDVKRPKLDGLTREEEKRRDAVRSALAGLSDEQGGPLALEAVLREKMVAEPAEPLWPLLLGSRMMELQRYGEADAAFEAVLARDADEIRAYYGAGMARCRAAEYKQKYGAAASAEVAPANVTVGSLYQGALRHFRRALDLTPDKAERDELATAAAIVERTLARKRGRL